MSSTDAQTAKQAVSSQEVPKAQVNFLLGPGGATLKRLSAATGCDLEAGVAFPPCPCCVPIRALRVCVPLLFASALAPCMSIRRFD